MTGEAIQIETDPVDRMTCHGCKAELAVAGVASFDAIVCPQCQAHLTVPARLGGFRLLALLGWGGMGAVYQAVDVALDRPVAIKVLLRSVGADPVFIETFQREAKAAAALNHPNIVQIYQFGREKGQPYIAMELLLGGHLDQMIAAGEPLDPARVLQMVVDVAEGLKAAGEVGLVHGDIKPENILLDANGTAKIVDFGLAAFMDRDTRPEGVWGTPYYIAPEKVRGKSGDLRSDIYSLGATLFHALTLKPPFEGSTAAEVVKARLDHPAPLLRSMRSDAHPEIERVVQRMLEAEPARRYPNYASLLADLREVSAVIGPPRAVTRRKGASGKVVISKPRGRGKIAERSADLSGAVSAADRAARKRRRARWARGLLAILALAGMAWGGWWYWQEHQARQAAAAQRIIRERFNAEVREGVSVFDQLVQQVQVLLTNAYALYPAATNRLALAEAEWRDIEGTAALAQTAPDLVAVPERIQAALDAAENLTDRMRARLAALVAQREDLRTAVDLEGAERVLLQIRRSMAEARDENETARAYLEIVGQAYASLDALQGMIAQQQTLLAEAERQRLEEEQRQREMEARLQAEEVRRQRLAEQLADDLRRLEAAREEVRALILRVDFEAALTLASSVRQTIQTEQGQRDADLWLERLNLLPELKQTIIGQLATAPFPWGWMARLDVIGADAETIQLPGRNIPWSEVPPAQILRFIDRYIDADAIERARRARFAMAAAAYSYENHALPLARTYALKAIGYQTRLRGDVQRIMPDIEDLQPARQDP